MLRYETLFLTVPEITSDEAGNLEKQFDKVITDAKGSVVSYDRWGKFKLSYPVRKYDYGVYYLMRFEVDDAQKDSLLASLRTLFGVKFVDLIMRNTVVRLDPKASLDYKRPESLEEAPSKEIDTIMKESKNFLGSSHQEEQKRDMRQDTEDME